MHRHYDVIVIGLGAMGSSAAFHLASRGLKVLGLERFNIPHEMGSSHGATRIIRLAYFEDPSYVPLLRRSYELWRELEGRLGQQLLYITGSLDIGAPGSVVFDGALNACQLHSLSHEVLTAEEVNRRFPGYSMPPNLHTVYQPEGGFLLPELCISAHVMLAGALGAEIHGRERVLGWEPHGDGVTVQTEYARYEADRLVISAGPWISEFIPAYRELVKPERQVLAWLQPDAPGFFTPEAFPVFNITVDEGRYYGFPVFGVPGFKFGRYHHAGEQVSPDQMDRECGPADEALLRPFAEKYFPRGAGSTLALRACLFTNTPDEHFILDQLPDHPQVVIASPCSGHGFKMSSVIGEILADLTTGGATRHDISLHRLSRFL